MARFNFFINGVIRAGDEADAKMYLQELIADKGRYTTLPIADNWLPICEPLEFFEVNVSEIEEQEEAEDPKTEFI
ncbi:MAG TPA: hypothetical protein VKA09_17230 [Nitrososphaeraceae archaeon]|nr:hypothetical protein [Nitrososphaeraceae archaeon]